MSLSAAGEDGPEFNPDQVFELLGNEARMEILQGLWDAYDPFADANGLTFSELYDMVGINDSGQFNYHLDRLRESYVTKVGDRYRLTTIGLRLVQSVIAGAGIEVDYEPTEVDAECRLCGAPIELTYDGQRVYFVCTECPGNFQDEAYPEGTLWGESMPPAGVINRSPEELFAAVTFIDWPNKALLTANICPQCTGVLDRSIEICSEHDSDGDQPCSSCGYSQPIQVNWLCSVCKYHAAGSPLGYIKNHPAVIAFRYDHGIDFGYPYTTSEFEETQTEESIRQEMSWELELVSENPVELQVTIGYEGDSITLTLDETMEVTSINRSLDTR